MSASELALWERFWNEEPWGAAVDDLRTGYLLSEMRNLWGRSKKTDPVAKPEDWFRSLRDESIDPVERWKAQLGAAFKRGG
jgi:hypothetical protein